jgi:hypothetical protein
MITLDFDKVRKHTIARDDGMVYLLFEQSHHARTQSVALWPHGEEKITVNGKTLGKFKENDPRALAHHVTGVLYEKEGLGHVYTVVRAGDRDNFRVETLS